MAILSEAMVSGFTTAAAVHVFSSQVKQVFGVSVPRRTGVFKLVKVHILLVLPEFRNSNTTFFSFAVLQ